MSHNFYIGLDSREMINPCHPEANPYFDPKWVIYVLRHPDGLTWGYTSHGGVSGPDEVAPLAVGDQIELWDNDRDLIWFPTVIGINSPEGFEGQVGDYDMPHRVCK